MPRNAKTKYAAVLLLGLSVVSCGSAPAPVTETGNTVVAFLKGAERQAETDDQRKTIQRALRDMLEKSPADLAQARYPDYTGKPGAWSITQLLPKYFVPNPPAVLDEQRFYQDVRSPAARAAIQHQLDEVTHAIE